MKKKFLLVILATLVLTLTLTGCGSDATGSGNSIFSSKKTVTCTHEEVDAEGYKTTDEMVVTYDNEKVLNVKSTMVTELDPTYLEFTLAFGQVLAETLNKVEGVSLSYEKAGDNSIKAVTSIDYEKLNPENVKKELGEMYDSDDEALYDAKGMSFEDFKKNSLAGYTCK